MGSEARRDEKGRTVWAVAEEGAPAARGYLGEADLDLDPADGVVAPVGVDLALEGLEEEGVVAVLVGELCATRGVGGGVGQLGGWRKKERRRTLRGRKATATVAGFAPLSKTERVRRSSVS